VGRWGQSGLDNAAGGPKSQRSMRLLDRYLLRESLMPIGYCLAFFFVFWVSFDLIGDLDELQQRQLSVREVAEYYAIRTPELLVTVMPLALLLALLYALTQHARHQELTAMRAAGVSLWRLCWPYWGLGLGFTAGVFALNELWVPTASARAERVLARHQAVGAAGYGPEWQTSLTFHNERDRRVWNIGAFNRETGEMVSAHFEWTRPDGSRRVLAAERARHAEGVWRFESVKELHYAAGASLPDYRGETDRLDLPELTETPELIDSEIKFSELSNTMAAKRPRLSLREVLNYRRLHPTLGPANRAKLETQLHGRLAEPWTCLVVVLIAIPFGAPSGRRNVFVGAAASIFIGFGFFVLQRLGLALGTGGCVAAWLGAWLPNVTFAVAGWWLTSRVR